MTPGAFDIPEFKERIQAWMATFSSFWKDSTTKDYDATLHWLEQLYSDECSECVALASQVKAEAAVVKDTERTSADRKAALERSKALRAELNAHTEGNLADADSRPCKFHRFSWPTPMPGE
jgi:hypothetical protein